MSVYRWICCSCFAVHIALLGFAAFRDSFVWTETGALPAGIIHWHAGRYDIFRTSPPTYRMLATLPSLLLEPELPGVLSFSDPRRRNEWDAAREFLRLNGASSRLYLTLGRLASIPWSLLGMWVSARWAHELGGVRAGLFTMIVWAFLPSFLAHGHLMTGDMAAAAIGVAVMHCFVQWSREVKWTRTIFLGLLVGGAVLFKTSWLMLVVLLPCLWLAIRFFEDRNEQWCWRGSCLNGLREGGHLLFAAMLAVLTINLAYEFEGSGRRLGDYRFLSCELSGNHERESLNDPAWRGDNIFSGGALAALPVPFPRDFVVGLDLQKWDFQRPRESYLRGEWREQGWWYYYLYASLIKVPLALQVFLAIALISSVWRWNPEEFVDALVLLGPVIAIYFLVSRETGLNKHSRYVLTALPFLIVFASQCFAGRLRRQCSPGNEVPLHPNRRPSILRRFYLRGASILLVWLACSSLWIYPHSLSYFNESIGGPMNGPSHLVSSNVDWGQDLTYLSRW
ncbi:ArnT family glycosyltransferase, partial [Rhodopirellula bahusiensis]